GRGGPVGHRARPRARFRPRAHPARPARHPRLDHRPAGRGGRARGHRLGTGRDDRHAQLGAGLMLSVRTVLLALAFAFTAYLAARGLLWTTPIDAPILVVGSLVVYVAGTWLCLLVQTPS